MTVINTNYIYIIFKITVYVAFSFFFFQAEDGIRDYKVTGVQTCALPISPPKMLGDRDLNVVLTPLPRNRRGKSANRAEGTAGTSEAPEPPDKTDPSST